MGLLLAGGRSRRFGSEKAVTPFDGGLLMDRPLAALGAVCDQIAVSARPGSGAERRAIDAGLPVLWDNPEHADGPLAGIHAGLAWASAAGADWLATAPCDAPSLSARHYRALCRRRGQGAAVARSPRGLEPLVALWPVESGLSAITLALRDGQHPAIGAILDRLGAVAVPGYDGANVNAPTDLLSLAVPVRRDARSIWTGNEQVRADQLENRFLKTGGEA